jgi:uncharacterized protein YkwD
MKRSSVAFSVAAMLLAVAVPATATQAPLPAPSPVEQSNALVARSNAAYAAFNKANCDIELSRRLLNEMYQILLESNRLLEANRQAPDYDFNLLRSSNAMIRRTYNSSSSELQAREKVCAEKASQQGESIGSIGSTTPATVPEQFRMPAESERPLPSLEYLHRWAHLAFNLHTLAAARCDLAEMRAQRTKLETLSRAAEEFRRKVNRRGTRLYTQEEIGQANSQANTIRDLWKAALAQPPMNCPTAPREEIRAPAPSTIPVPPIKKTQDCPSPGKPGGQTLPEHGMRFTPPDEKSERMLAAHNRARADVGVPPLIWDRELAAGAAAYATQMSRVGRVHAPRAGRECVRENMLQSLPGSRSPEQMVGVWLAEKANFKSGVFPDVSTTGDWAKVGHYTQVIWATTTHVGCATYSDKRYDWTVCRYTPPGNRDGVPIGYPNQRLADRLCAGRDGLMMCPDPEQDGEGQEGEKEDPQDGAGNGQAGEEGQPPAAGQAPGIGTTRARETPEPPIAGANDAITEKTPDCSVGVLAKVLIPTGRMRNGKPVYKETHNLAHGFTEVVIPFGFEAKGDFRPSADETSPYDGTMTASWGIAGVPNPFTGTVTGNRAKLARGKWDDTDGVVTINPGPNRPVVQRHEINAHWTSPMHGVQCRFRNPFQFVVTFAAAVPLPGALNLKEFVEGADRAGFPGTRPRTPFTTGTRAFHEPRPKPFSRDDYVIFPIGIFWDLPESCCDIRRAEREVIQFARAAIEGPNGRQGKGWGLDILPSELEKARKGNHDPVYTGHPNEHGEDQPTPGGAGGTKTNAAGDVMQWDAPGMPKDLFDRLLAAQGPSVYRQQFLSLLICRPPGGISRVRTHLAGSKVCQVAITTVRWDFPGQQGVGPGQPYRPPTISVFFDARDGNCTDLRAFLAANGFLDAFERPSSEARKLEILPPNRFQQLGDNVRSWEANPFGEIQIPPP